jgi:SagB-type dehydrogenase family enzyme
MSSPHATDSDGAADVVAVPVVCRRGLLAGLVTAPSVILAACAGSARPAAPTPVIGEVALPSPQTHGGASLAEVVVSRRSIREYAARPLTTTEIGQLLWAAQGATGAGGKRAAPSAGALYPLELYVADGGGISRYVPARHALAILARDDRRRRLAAAAGQQAAVAAAPLLVVIAAVASRTAGRYGDRAVRFVTLEAGHAAHGLLLAAVGLGLGAVPIGSFDDEEVAHVLGLAESETPLYVIAAGESQARGDAGR